MCTFIHTHSYIQFTNLCYSTLSRTRDESVYRSQHNNLCTARQTQHQQLINRNSLWIPYIYVGKFRSIAVQNKHRALHCRVCHDAGDNNVAKFTQREQITSTFVKFAILCTISALCRNICECVCVWLTGKCIDMAITIASFTELQASLSHLANGIGSHGKRSQSRSRACGLESV